MLYQPHDYQKYATNFIVEHPIAAVLLQMGLGKSVITLTAIAELALERFEVCRVMIIAPLRVARDTWPAEIQKWDHLKGLTYSVAVGTEAERRAALQKDTLIHIINRENVQWLIEQSGLPFQYDMLVIDEAHLIPDVASDAFGLSISGPGIRRELSRIYDPRKKRGLIARSGLAEFRDKQIVCDAIGECEELFAKIKKDFLLSLSLIHI